MSSLEERLLKLREERLAREKARIEKLRELNLKKYNKNEPQPTSSGSIVSNKSKMGNVANKASMTNLSNTTKNVVKNNLHVNGAIKRPISANFNTKNGLNTKNTNASKDFIKGNMTKINKVDTKPVQQVKQTTRTIPVANKSSEPVKTSKTNIPLLKVSEPTKNLARKSVAPVTGFTKPSLSRKSVQPSKVNHNAETNKETKESVFDRLYKPKTVPKKSSDDVTKLQTDPNYLKKVLKDSGLIVNKRHTVFDLKTKKEPVRRSISAVHFKRISKAEINNCIHKWSSIGEKLDKVHLSEINEDETVKIDKVVSAVKSERKKVKFQTPVPFNFNTPRPEELQSRLKSWLQKRGKSLDSYHHLQCFGVHHISKVKPIEEPPKFELYDDEDKENVALEHDSDNDSYSDNINDEIGELDIGKGGLERDKWRRASYVSDSNDLNETRDTVCSTTTTSDTLHHVDDVLMGALNDLTDLLREGFDWDQCARWLRAVRERFPCATDTAAYWECRAALEERRGDLPASVQCWEEAIAKGTERSVVEANLDQLLDKFMQLKISPNSGKRKRADPKMVDVKNVFKSTIIRFAVQQAKLRGSEAGFTATPVRRSARLSVRHTPRTPLQQLCTSIRHVDVPGPLLFVPNDKLCNTP